jgi:hypothetical protein
VRKVNGTVDDADPYEADSRPRAGGQQGERHIAIRRKRRIIGYTGIISSVV